MNQQNTLQGPGRLSIVINCFQAIQALLYVLGSNLFTSACLRGHWLRVLTPSIVSRPLLPVRRWSWVCRQAFRFHPAVLFQKDDDASK